MSKILKNTTNSDIDVLSMGVRIPANGQLNVDVSEYLILASNDSVSELTTLINSGDIVVSDGVNDLTPTNGINYIKFPTSPQDMMINGTPIWDYIGFTPSQNVYVDKNGSDSNEGTALRPFLTVKAAVESIQDASATKPYTVLIGSGIFIENPFTLTEYINLKGDGTRTRLQASDINSNLITQKRNTTVSDLSIQGVTNAYCIYADETNAGVCSFNNVFFSTSQGGYAINSTTGTFSSTGFDILAFSITDEVFEAYSNTRLTIQSASVIGNGSTSKSIVQKGTSEIIAFNVRDRSCDVGVETNGAGKVSLYNYDTSATTPFKQNSVDTEVDIIGGIFDATKVSASNLDKIHGYFHSNQLNDQKVISLSELSVGTPALGRETAMGQGDSYTNGMLVYTYNGSTYTNVSSTAASPDSSTFGFPSGLLNDTIYISTAFSLSNPLKFYGMKIKVDTACSLNILGDLVFEYWNGSSWVEFNHMMVQSNSPYRSFANSKLEQAGNFQCYFDSRLEESWQTNDPVSLGVSLYWIRLRVEGVNLTTNPLIEQIKIHTNRMEIESDGFQTMYGLGRIKEKFPITFTGLAGVPGKGPNSEEVYISDNLGIDLIENSFPSNAARSSVFTQFIPFELDTSCPVELTLSYFVDSITAGDIYFRLRWATTSPDDGIYKNTSGAPSTFSNERTSTGTVSVGLGENNKLKVFSTKLDIPEAVSQQVTGNPNSKLWISIERVGNSSQDTYSGNAIVTDLAVFYTAWREGGYSGEF